MIGRPGTTGVLIGSFCLVAIGVVALLSSRPHSLVGTPSRPSSTPSEEELAVPVQLDPSLEESSSGEVRQAMSEQAGRLLTAEPTLTETLLAARAELASQADAALNGTLYVDDVLDHMLTFASLPVNPFADLEYQDNDAIAYKLEGAPDGTEVHMLVGMQPIRYDGKDLGYLQLDVRMEDERPDFHAGFYREGPRVDFTICYDLEDPGTPVRFSMLVQRNIDLRKSRDAGIDPLTGRYTTGSYYWVDFQGEGPPEPIMGTVGLVDGNPKGIEQFDGVSPLLGDTEVDMERLTRMLEQLQDHLHLLKKGKSE